MSALIILTENGNAVFSAIDHSAELIPDLQRGNLGCIRILLIDQRSVGETLLIHSRRKAQEMCQKLFVPHQAIGDFRPVVEDGVVSAQKNLSFLSI